MAERDVARVRRAATRIGLTVGIMSAVVIAGGGLVLVAVLLAGSRHGDGQRGAPADDDDVRLVIDTGRVLPVVIVLCILGMLILGVVAWMAARRAVRPLAQALRAQRDFVADASHELRTPLTILDTRIQVLLRRLERGDPPGEVAGRLREDVANMSEVLDDLLLGAEGAANPNGELTDVGSAVRVAVERMQPIAETADVHLSVEVDGALRVVMPSVPLERCVVALVDNAIGHSPDGGEVRVGAAVEGGWCVVRVTDQGPGIAEDPERVFARFARGSERGRRRGFGLGLALVRDIVDRFGGDVGVEHTSSAGTTFRVRVPTVRRPAD